VNAADEIFVWNSDARTWVRVPGSLHNVGIASGMAVGCNAGDRVYYMALPVESKHSGPVSAAGRCGWLIA
jgi:hypothetical protein